MTFNCSSKMRKSALLGLVILLLSVTLRAAAQQDASAGSMTFRQVRDGILALVTNSRCAGWPINNTRVTYTALEFSGSVMTTNGFPHPENRSGTFSLAFKDIQSAKRYGWPCGAERTDGADSVQIELKSREPARHVFVLFNSAGAADQFVEYLSWLVAHADENAAAAAARTENFRREVSAWKAAAVKPSMPEDAHAHQILAENAYREKNLDKAIDEYEAALDIFPTWPAGQFNVALFCGETGDFDCAVEHMQDYLELVPNAPNAQAAKDKLVVWKDKERPGK